MNAEVVKAMNKKETKIKGIRKWWRKNGYKVMRVIFFPIWICVWSKDKIENHLNARQKWSDERANEIVSKSLKMTADGTIWNQYGTEYMNRITASDEAVEYREVV